MYLKELTDEENEKIFGACSNPNWHGHNYVLFVTVKGHNKPETGWLINLKQLSRIIKEHVVSKIDHKNINIEVDFMKNKLASTENLAVSIWEVLEPHVRHLGAFLHCVKIAETENNYIEYYGE